MLTGIYDTQCAFMCFNVTDILQFIDQAQSMGQIPWSSCSPPSNSIRRQASRRRSCARSTARFAEGFADEQPQDQSRDPDKAFKIYVDMTKGMVHTHQR